MVRIEREDYYSNMYDIEDLTHLSKRPKSTDPDVIEVEDLIRGNKCEDALVQIQNLLVGERNQSSELEILSGALYVKELLWRAFFKKYESYSPKECVLDELNEYTGKSREILLKKVLVEVPVSESWEELNPNPESEEEVERFYMETESYVYELMAGNNIVQTLYSYSILIKKLEKLDLRSIVDYGGGAGTLAILFHELEYDVTYADLPGKTFDFAKWRFYVRSSNIKMIDLKKQEISDSDCIICTEVFEHVVNPIKLLEALKSKVKKGKYLVISESCEYTEEFSSHLESNKKYGGKNFIKLMEEHGFEQIEKEPYIPQMIFRKK